VIKSGSTGYGSGNVQLQQDIPVNTGSYGAPSSINLVKSVGSSSYGSGIDNSRTLLNVDTSSYGSGASTRFVPQPLPPVESSYGNTFKSVGGSSYGNNVNSYGSSYGNNARSLGPLPLQPTGQPYGIQSTRDFSGLVEEQLDVSKCGQRKNFLNHLKTVTIFFSSLFF
jgi:hypothetical protein